MTNASLVTVGASLVVGLVVGIFVPPLRDRFFYHPKLSLNFDPDDGRCIANTSESRWARISVVNHGKIYLTKCHAFVTNIEQKRSDREGWEKIKPQFIDPLVLEWASLPEDIKYEPRDIPRNIEIFVNVLYAGSDPSQNDTLLLTIYKLQLPDRLKGLFKVHNSYRITVTVTGEQIKPETKQFVVDWKGHWQFCTSKAEENNQGLFAAFAKPLKRFFRRPS